MRRQGSSKAAIVCVGRFGQVLGLVFRAVECRRPGTHRDDIWVWNQVRVWASWRSDLRAYALEVDKAPDEMLPLVGKLPSGRMVFWPKTNAPLVDSRGDTVENVPEEISAAVWRLRREIMIDTTRRREGARTS